MLYIGIADDTSFNLLNITFDYQYIFKLAFTYVESDSSILLNFYLKYTNRGKTNELELTYLHFYSVDITKHLAKFLT